MRRQVRIVLLALTGAGLLGCEQSAAPAYPQQQVTAGEALFEQHCMGCHPREGRGDYLRRIPATMLVHKSEQELVAWIRGQGQHREMPSFTYLTQSEVRDLAAYLKSRVDQHY